MMAANYRHIGGGENRLGRHYSRFSAFWPPQPLPINHLLCENPRTEGRIGEVGLGTRSPKVCFPRLRPGDNSPAVSSPEAFRTPASVRSLTPVSGRRPKTLNTSTRSRRQG